jgi:23S rRNA pseudouridine1911/1915/1917 synthase
VSNFHRQALHAIKLGLIHPASNEFMEWQIELADDMKVLLEAMRHEDVKDDEEEFELSMEPYLADEDYEYDEDDEFDDFEADDGDLEPEE